MDDNLGLQKSRKMAKEQWTLSPLLWIHSNTTGRNRGHGKHNPEVVHCQELSAPQPVIQFSPVVHQNPDPVLFDEGLVLLKVERDLSDIFKVDPESPNHWEDSWARTIVELNDDSPLVMEGIINQCAPEGGLLYGQRSQWDLLRHLLILKWGG